jgi:uncharacterized cofD-like protein
MHVKRWVCLSFVSMASIVVGFLLLFGIDLARAVYRAAPADGWAHVLWVALFFALGVGGFGFSLFRLVRSVARGVAPSAREKPSALIYRTRILEGAPNVVAIGGGTGLSTLLRGLKEVTANLTAIVTVTDDGGSSGRLRRELDTLPPGDVRNCILALAEDESQLSNYLQHRLTEPESLAGHSLGNLLLAGLEQAAGGFDRAIEAMSQFLSVRGRVLPTTLVNCQLVAVMSDGTRVEGESRIAADPRTISSLTLSTSPVPAYSAVLEAIRNADLLILGPGSLYTSIIPNLLVDGVADAIADAPAEKLLVANLMTQPGETEHYSLRDHLRVLDEYVPVSRFDAIIVNSARPADGLLHGYRSEEAEPVPDDLETENEYGLRVVRADVMGTARWQGRETVKHSPEKLARVIVEASSAFSTSRRERTLSP